MVAYPGWGASTASLAAARRCLSRWRAVHGAVGVSVAVMQHGRLHLAMGEGVSDRERQTPATGETIYRVASVTKPMTAVAVLRLVEAGLVGLDDPISRYAADLPAHIRPLPVRQLLSHTAGIRHYRYELGERECSRAFDSRAEAIRIYGVLDEPLQTPPGSAFCYSSYGFNLLSCVVEHASGMSLEDFMTRHVFVAAGMPRTSLEDPTRPVAGRSRQYVIADGEIRLAPRVDVRWKHASGGALSSAVDVVRFSDALLSDRLLSASTRAELLRPAVTAAGPVEYGLGWRVWSDGLIGHGGGATGGAAYLLARPADGISVAVITNLEVLAAQVRELGVALLETVSAQQSIPEARCG
jgi:CubicO group peptidase (beta-lactamase class C family)